MDDAELEMQAQAMAEKALEKLPEGVRAVKIEKVKEGILKRLKAQAANGPGAGAGAAPTAPNTQPTPPPAPPPGSPPPPPPTPVENHVPIEKLDGIELCGDEPWFADTVVRRALRDSVVAAHAEQKILVGPPADEIKRICPGNGRVLGAGAVLRLGGATLGGYGEADIGYAYRQLSRALHPDKNPDIPDAPDAFKRLSEAADELRQGLTESRTMLQIICGTMGGTATPEMLERPQVALFAEATRLIFALISLLCEGEVPEAARSRGMPAFTSSPFYSTCHAQLVLSSWFDNTTLLDLFASMPFRSAYDCTPKHYRAQFLCALNRLTCAEAKLHNECIRGSWQKLLMQFPELEMWRELREKLRARVWTVDGWSAGDEGGEGRRSKWDDKNVPKTSSWAGAWRKVIRAILPRGVESAVPAYDIEIRKLGAAMWKEIATWAKEVDLERSLQLFTAGPVGPTPGNGSDEQPDLEWAFIPATDLLLVVGDGIVGITAEGVFASNRPGHERLTYEAAISGSKTRRGDKSRSRSRSRSRDLDARDEKGRSKDDRQSLRLSEKDLQKEKFKDFDWEKEWRSRKMQNQHRRTTRPSDRLRSVSRSRERGRRHRSRSRERRRRSVEKDGSEPRRRRSRSRKNIDRHKNPE